jgi:hypothetical protein
MRLFNILVLHAVDFVGDLADVLLRSWQTVYTNLLDDPLGLRPLMSHQRLANFFTCSIR